MEPKVIGAIGDREWAESRRCMGSSHTTERWEGGVISADGTTRLLKQDGLYCCILGNARHAEFARESLPGTNSDLRQWKELLLSSATSPIDKRLAGHFAIFFIDATARAVTLVVDRFSTYPIYFHATRGGVIFSDRVDALFAAPPVLSPQAIFDYLYFHMLPGPSSIHEGVSCLEPASILRWCNGEITQQRYWTAKSHQPIYEDFDEARVNFRRILKGSVEHECTSDSVGTFLSGGTDSSTVLGVLSEVSNAPVKSYSMGFDVKGYDEAAFAQIVAERFGSNHRQYYVTAGDIVSRLPRVAKSMDQPFGNSSLLPTMICAERAREDGVSKLLAGDGGDELFGGNTRYAKQRVFGLYETIPLALRRLLIEPVTDREFVARVPLISKLKSYVDQARVPLPERLETYNTLERETIANVFTGAFLAQIDVDRPLSLQRKAWQELVASDLVNALLEYDWKYTLADNDLRKVRFGTGMAGIDVGFPLLSDELVDFSLRLKPDWKVKGLKLRWFFKEALKDLLPPEIIEKKKHGFGLPFGSWACEFPELRAIAVSSINQLAERGLLREAYARSLIKDRLPRHPSYYGEFVWILMMLELWLQWHSPNWVVGFQGVRSRPK